MLTQLFRRSKKAETPAKEPKVTTSMIELSDAIMGAIRQVGLDGRDQFIRVTNPYILELLRRDNSLVEGHFRLAEKYIRQSRKSRGFAASLDGDILTIRSGAVTSLG